MREVWVMRSETGKSKESLPKRISSAHSRDNTGVCVSLKKPGHKVKTPDILLACALREPANALWNRPLGFL
jgi:hypothetical protein